MGAQVELPLFETRRPLTVGELTRRIKRLIEDPLRFVSVIGEISNMKERGGHYYFTLKDDEATLSCIIWESYARSLKFEPADGMEVVAWGRIEVYAPYGRYQLYVEGMEPKGVGALQLRFEQLKEKLQKEGLFDQTRKRPLPFLPRRIAIVTSPTGAAIQDMLRTITARFPRSHVLLYPVRVQGEGAAHEIAHAIQHINMARPDVEVMIIGRGGGSIEDLWAFNEEIVARAVSQSRIPVISAVGHETDFTISDFVADVRALTPTDAGQRVVPLLADLLEHLGELRLQLSRALRATLEREERALDALSKNRHLRSPESIALHARERLEDLTERLAGGLRDLPRDHRQRLTELHRGLLAALAPLREIRRQQALEREERALDRALRMHLESRRRALAAHETHLRALDPKSILGRGYSITRDGAGRVVKDAASLHPGDELRTTLCKGEACSRVIS